MHRWQWITVAVLLVAAIGYGWLTSDPPPDIDIPKKIAVQPKDDGDAESSDAIEPLVVDRAARGFVALSSPAPVEMEAMPRVVAGPGSTQPARPEGVTFMPYADEDMQRLHMCLNAAVRIVALFSGEPVRYVVRTHWDVRSENMCWDVPSRAVTRMPTFSDDVPVMNGPWFNPNVQK